MATLKTSPTTASVGEFLARVPDDALRRDAQTVSDLMTRITGEAPTMWGESIVGFGSQHLRYASGRELDWFVVGFAPRKQALTVYIMDGFTGYEQLLARLGKHSTGKSCLYIKRLDDVDVGVLEELLAASVAHLRAGH